MTLYVDVLFAINFSMDFLSLYFTNAILHKKLYKFRLLISALIGGLYGVIEFVVTSDTLFGAIFNILVSVLMCIIAYKKSSIGRLITSIILFWGVSASLGGIMSLVYSFVNKLFYEYIKDYSYTEIYSGARFFIVASLSVLIAVIVNGVYSTKKEIRETEVLIEFKGEVFKLNGLCDSGNLLKEPISGKNVILISKNTKLGQIIEKEQEIKKRYVPYNVVNGEGVLKGIIPNKIIINKNEVNAIVAPIENKNFCGLDAIVPISLL